MGLKEILDAQRAKEAQAKQPMKGGDVDTSRGNTQAGIHTTTRQDNPVPQVASPTPAPAAGAFKPKIGMKLGPKPPGEKKDEKVTIPAPRPEAQAQNKGNQQDTKSVVLPNVQTGNGVDKGIRNDAGGTKSAEVTPAVSIPEVAGELPEGVIELKKNIAFLSANIEQKELVGQVVRTILVQLRRNPQFSTHMVDTDFDVITRGFRRSAVIAARKKTEKREATAAKKKDKSEFSDFMDSSNFSMDLDD